MRRPSRENGFTLIELLVVIAIIALLVSILVPMLGTAREMGRRVSCAANEHNMGIGVGMYVNDFQETVPPFYSLPYPPYSQKFWDSLIVPYFDSEARPPGTGAFSEPPASPGLQPASGDYSHTIHTLPPDYGTDYFTWNPDVRYSRKMNCPTQKNADSFEYVMNLPYFSRMACWIYSTYGMNPGWNRTPMKISNYRAGDFCTIIEAGAPTGALSWPLMAPHYTDGNAQHLGWTAFNAPHLKTTNMLMLDGHSTLITASAIVDYITIYNAPGHKAGYPFNIPGYD